MNFYANFKSWLEFVTYKRKSIRAFIFLLVLVTGTPATLIFISYFSNSKIFVPDAFGINNLYFGIIISIFTIWFLNLFVNTTIIFLRDNYRIAIEYVTEYQKKNNVDSAKLKELITLTTESKDPILVLKWMENHRNLRHKNEELLKKRKRLAKLPGEIKEYEKKISELEIGLK